MAKKKNDGAGRHGGTHRVRDEDLTNTQYDSWNYNDLAAACKDPDRQLYVKDMKKADMARALAKFDEDAKNVERANRIAAEKRQREQARQRRIVEEKEQQAQAARVARNHQRQVQRDPGVENVSDDSPDEEEPRIMHNELLGVEENQQELVGEALSEDSWDSTSTESSMHLNPPSIGHASRLRLFEWTYPTMPSPTGLATPSPTSGQEPARLVRSPTSKPYTPMRLYTTETNEKVWLPGRLYHDKNATDYAPILDKRTRDAARNGVLVGRLNEATIESAAAQWARKTRIQGWNGRMFFKPGPRDPTKNLQDVYKKYELENRRLLRVRPKGDGEKISRARRHELRHQNKAKRYAEIIEASEYRPLLMCYLPAYMEFDHNAAAMKRRQRKERRGLSNLFYIRLPEFDVPHYYFWMRKGEWQNPCVPNPVYDPEVQMEDDEDDEDDTDESDDPPEKPLTHLERKRNSVHIPLPELNYPLSFANSTALFEHQLREIGLTTVLILARNKWRAQGKAHLWAWFAKDLHRLYPSGRHEAPPPEPWADDDYSIAEKLAGVEVNGDRNELPPLTGGEPWTRNDDQWWYIIEADQDGNEVRGDALYRRTSTDTPKKCSTWVQQISPSHAPLSPDVVPSTPMSLSEWEDKYLQLGMDVKCPVCLRPLSGRTFQHQAEHFSEHSAPGTGARRSTSMGRDRWASEATIYPVDSISRRGTATRVRFAVSDDEEEEGDDEESRLDSPSYSSTPLAPYAYVPTVKRTNTRPAKSPAYTRLVNTHPNATNVAKRKRSYSTIISDSTNLPQTKRRKVPEITATVAKGRNGKEEVFYALARRQSDTTYQPPASARVPSGRKRRRVADPTFRPVEVEEEIATYQPPASARVPSGRKRRRVADPTFRPVEVEEEIVPVVKESSRKRKKVVDTTYRPEPIAEEVAEDDVVSSVVTRRKMRTGEVGLVEDTPVLKRRRKSVDLNGEYVGGSGNGYVSGSGSKSPIWANEVDEGWWAWSGLGDWCEVM